MGYARNHLATLVMGVFAAVLSFLWFIMVPMFPVLNFVFLMAVPIMWFLVISVWISQKSADFMAQYHGSEHEEKKNHNSTVITRQVYTSSGKKVGQINIHEAKSELSNELDELKNTVKLKDGEIERLKGEIANLETLVQIEALKSELANLKVLASKQK